MLDESLRRRLEALNRGQLPAAARVPRPDATPSARPGRGAKDLQRVKPACLLERGEVVATALGQHLRIAVPVADVWPQADQLLAARHQFLTSQAAGEGPDERAGFLGCFPERFVALDLETCGLSGAALFLIGIARQVEQQLVVELLFARNYAEEAAVLCSLGKRLATAQTLVTFNGKSFDWPMVTDRWHRHLLHRTTPLPKLAHYDVLHHARRRWRRTLPDCKLQTIERMICRRGRTGDIAGHLIPGAYDHYVQTGSTTEIEQVLYHNALDLVTLLDIAMRLAG